MLNGYSVFKFINIGHYMCEINITGVISNNNNYAYKYIQIEKVSFKGSDIINSYSVEYINTNFKIIINSNSDIDYIYNNNLSPTNIYLKPYTVNYIIDTPNIPLPTPYKSIIDYTLVNQKTTHVTLNYKCIIHVSNVDDYYGWYISKVPPYMLVNYNMYRIY